MIVEIENLCTRGTARSAVTAFARMGIIAFN